MKKIIAALTLLLVTPSAFAADDNALDLKDAKNRNSYAVGVNIAQSIKRQPADLNPDAIAAAIRDVLMGKEPRMTDAQVRETLVALQKEMFDKMTAKMEADAAKNKKDGAAFIAENKKKEGVVTTASGLQYKILTKGDGKIPKPTDIVTVHYKGTLIDGTEFDSSHKRGEPAKFPANGVIKGWVEALQLMTVGSKWQVVIPPDLAYGEDGAGEVIGPNSTLIFDVELISIEEKKP